MKAFSKKLSLKNSVQQHQISLYEETKGDKSGRTKERRLASKVASVERVNSQTKKKLHNTINSQLSMQNTVVREKKLKKTLDL